MFVLHGMCSGRDFFIDAGHKGGAGQTCDSCRTFGLPLLQPRFDVLPALVQTPANPLIKQHSAVAQTGILRQERQVVVVRADPVPASLDDS
ncbi:hypothetical protein AO353_21110 [Pseudomonas fluorescens]|uniref:Uncharacterized protein n=1 Tax=Pseudomonas fluorescens TaxID=294 RepID=A0A0N7H0L1_PSEFL|nr:hypothetical protein AO353_21110 [Pseudomonas fluorescens]